MSKVYAATDIGSTRPMNEDSFACMASDTYVVADGMGGHAAGEVASHIFVDTVQEVLDGASNIDELTLKNAVLKANDEILQKVSVHPEYAGMGTTATLFHADVDVCVFAHVGDSRLYHIHDGKITQLTKDHSFVQDLIEKGKITPEEARNHPKRNMLMPSELRKISRLIPGASVHRTVILYFFVQMAFIPLYLMRICAVS